MTTSHRGAAAGAGRVEPPDSFDDFPTPHWATRALLEKVLFTFGEPITREDTVWEPTANRGYMVSALREFFRRVTSSDVFDYSEDRATEIVQDSVRDFLFPDLPPHIEAQGVDWIIANPPFRLSAEFFQRAIEIGPRGGIALLLRLQWLEGETRWSDIFSAYAPGLSVHPFAERVNIFKKTLSPDNPMPRAYAWYVCRAPYVVDRTVGEFPVRHIPPCRAQLERETDYLVRQDAEFHMKPQGETPQPDLLLAPET